MTSVEDIPATTTTSSEKADWLSPEEIKIFRALLRAFKEAEFKENQDKSGVATAADTKINDSSQGDTKNTKESQLVSPERTAVEPSSYNLDARLETTGQLKTTGGADGSRLDMVSESRKNGRKSVSDIAHEDTDRMDEGKTAAAPVTDTDVRSRPVVGVGTAGEKEKNEPDDDIYHKLYKQFKDVNGKLLLLENAISRLGGVGDVLSGIRQMRAVFEIALRWNLLDFPSGDVRVGKLDLEEVLAKVEDECWQDLEEDGEVFTGLQNVKVIVERLPESAEAMDKAFDELGTVNGCQFVSLCTALRAVRKHISDEGILRRVKGFAASQGLDVEKLAVKSVLSTFEGPLNEALESLSNVITEAINRDIPNLHTAEQRVTDKYNNMSTTATFFSGITATAIQITVPMTGSALKDAVNTVWLISLVFSVGSVIASLISLSWLQSRISMRAKEKGFKRGVIFLLRNGPVILMTAAAATFMIGLALFVNSSDQARITWIVTSSFIVLVSVILIFLAICFALLHERNTLSWSLRSIDELYKYARTAPLRIWHRIALLVEFREHEYTEDPTGDLTKDLTKSFLDESGTSPVSNITTEPSLGKIKQLLWRSEWINPRYPLINSEKATRGVGQLLITTSNGLILWSERARIFITRAFKSLFETSGPIQDAIWTEYYQSILAIEPTSMTHIHNTGKAYKIALPQGIHVLAAQYWHTPFGENLVCIADVADSGQDNVTAERRLMVLAYRTGEIVYSGTRIKRTASSLQISVVDNHFTKVLLSFADGSSPQLWHLKRHNLTSWEVKPKFKYDMDECICISAASFSGSRDELVVCAVDCTEDDSEHIYVWSTDEATMIRWIDIGWMHSGFPTCITWKVDEAWTLAWAAAYDDGKVVMGEISFFDSIDEDIRMNSSNT
ncbi:hypothetical protein EW145_g5373 [Phellinidium pouzarii]|uniref:Uncharacterized protein n=1 Tax=Phellinidium pouzarii TaxID=167371 RepID=A0A4S4L225_9AGAM|nr:hypothetical protein EW145_g5373 [Phellinidium pouzarii]